MHSASLNQRQARLRKAMAKEEQRQEKDATVEQDKRRPVPAPLQDARLLKSRIYAILVAIGISGFVILSRRASKSPLPSSWALCTRPGSFIYTVDANEPSAECIVIHNERIVDRGSKKDVQARWGDMDTTGPVIGAPAVSAKSGLKFKYLKPGEAAFPGFTDAHAHVLEYGAFRDLNLADTTSIDGIIQRLREYILSRPEILNDKSAFIMSWGWNQNLYPGGAFPVAADLETDDILKGRPIVLARVDGHSYWVSQKILDMLKPLPDDVPGGVIRRDSQGNPTGIFVDNAMALVDQKRPPWTEKQMLHFFNGAVQDALAHGLTFIHDAMSSFPAINFFQGLAEKGALPIRLYLMANSAEDEYWGEKIPRLIGYGNDRLNLRSVKLVADGALGSWGAAMIEPYSDNSDTRGLEVTAKKVLWDFIVRFHQDDWQVNVHCIGDRANRDVLDAFESVLASNDSTTLTRSYRHRIEHAQIMTQEDLKRTGRLGIIASVQPTHATSDMSYAEDRLGPKRIKGAYAWQTLKKNGAPLALGSDFPVEGIDPLLGFYAAITRLDLEGHSPHGDGGWFPEQRLSREEALHGMTLGAAYAAYQEEIIGSLTPGKRADIVILDKDIMRVQPSDILLTKVKATIVDGRLVYGRI
ncbi:hypothetical protein FRB96_006907 [Tulasnella sp. 330]|nr:hypothetical protein FRB96_006907 [Tulasnella sp. 330]